MNKKIGIIFGLILVIIVGVVASKGNIFKKNMPTDKAETGEKIVSKKVEENSYLLDGFPIEKVPLYKLEKVSSNKIFVNTDPRNMSTFDEKNFAYYNVVLYSTASKEEFLNYYKNLFEEEIIEEFASPDMVKGRIGEYKVSAAHYGSDNTGYIQVHLANYQDESINKYFTDYPELLEINEYMVEHEKSYGLLNQKGGEMEFTK